MANTLLTPDVITREALRILHQKLTFVGNINRAYDDSFAQEGAKIGDALRIRLPNQYVVRTGATMSAQDTVETQVTLTVATQKGVDLSFTDADLALDLDDFSRRILEPAMSVLSAAVESDALVNMTKDVYNAVDSDGTALSFKDLTDGGALLSDNLAPLDQRTALLSNTSQSTIVDALKGLFNDSSQVSDQYLEGMMGRTAGFNFFSSSHVANHQTGTAAKTTGYLVNGAAESGAAITVDGGTTTFLVGDIITIAGVYRVNAETKVSSGVLQQFVITSNSGTSATSLAISPSLNAAATGAQNVSNVPADNAAIVKVGAGASETMSSDLVYHKDSFTLATVDLVLPSDVDFGSRQVYDGISMRIVRQFQIAGGTFPTRVDVLYGYKTIRAQTAARIIHGA